MKTIGKNVVVRERSVSKNSMVRSKILPIAEEIFGKGNFELKGRIIESNIAFPLGETQGMLGIQISSVGPNTYGKLVAVSEEGEIYNFQESADMSLFKKTHIPYIVDMIGSIEQSIRFGNGLENIEYAGRL